MILQLSLFQIFFMALSIVGLSFSILYLFIGGFSYDSRESEALRESERNSRDSVREIRRDNVYDINSRKGQPRPAPVHRTSVGRQPVKAPNHDPNVIEVNYKVVHYRGVADEVTLGTISEITGRAAGGTGRW